MRYLWSTTRISQRWNPSLISFIRLDPPRKLKWSLAIQLLPSYPAPSNHHEVPILHEITINCCDHPLVAGLTEDVENTKNTADDSFLEAPAGFGGKAGNELGRIHTMMDMDLSPRTWRGIQYMTTGSCLGSSGPEPRRSTTVELGSSCGSKHISRGSFMNSASQLLLAPSADSAHDGSKLRRRASTQCLNAKDMLKVRTASIYIIYIPVGKSLFNPPSNLCT